VGAAGRQLAAAEDAEHKVLVGLARASRDRGKSQKLAAQGDRAARLAAQLAATDRQIEAVVAQALQEVRVTLAQEKTTLDAYRAELAAYEADNRALGGSVLAASEQTVKAKLYDIVIRTDLGNVDVSWSRKDDIDDDLKRLNLSRQRELRQLRDEFKDILDAGTPKPSAPAKPRELPQPAPNQPSGSPDKGSGDQRIAPGTARPRARAAPNGGVR
jgi:hypothetical protein